MAKDTWKPTPYRDPITNKVRTNPPSYPAGQGIISPNNSYSINSKIEKAQRERPNPSR